MVALELFIIIYFIILAVIVIIGAGVIISEQNDKYNLCIAINKIIERNLDDYETKINRMAVEIEEVYESYSMEKKHLKKKFPNVLMFFDHLKANINTNFKKKKEIKKMEQHYDIFNLIHQSYKDKYPYCMLNDKQQKIMQFLGDIETKSNKAALANIKGELKQEFLNHNTEGSKNRVYNTICLTVGVLGVLISVILAFSNILSTY